MSNESISITLDREVLHFDVGSYLHEDGERCKIKVFDQGKLVASFTPDRNHILHICQNPGNLREEVLHMLADAIEARHPYGFDYGQAM